jgi:hypothetical protein
MAYLILMSIKGIMSGDEIEVGDSRYESKMASSHGISCPWLSYRMRWIAV